MKTSRKLLFLAISFAVICQLAFTQRGFGGKKPDETVSLSSIPSLNGLSTNNKYYTIDENVRVEPPNYRFQVKSPHGEYDVSSTKDLLKVCHEIRIIEEFRATDQGDQAWDAAGESLKNMGRGAKKIVKEPKESAKAFARAGGKLARSIGRFIKKTVGKEGEEKSGDGVDRDKAGEGFFTGKHARQFASELGLDVYTDNPYAQTLIQEVAKSRSKGTIGVSVGTFFLAPVQGLGLLSNSLTPNGFNAEMEGIIREDAPDELRHVLTERYKKDLEVAGEEGSPIKALLDNPNYSPREQAYLYHHLKGLVKPESGSGTAGLQDALHLLGKAKSPDAATFATNQMELLSAYQQYEKNLTRFAAASNKLGAVTAKKELLFIIPYDVADDTPEMQKFLDEAADTAKTQGVKETQVWLTGQAKGGFLSKAKGVTVKENVLKLPHFAPKAASEQEPAAR